METITKEVEEKILQLLSKKIMSVSQLSKEIGVKRYLLAGYLEALKNSGKLEAHIVGRSKIYTIKKGGKDEK